MSAATEDDDPSQSKPPYAALALSLTVQDWGQLGVDESTSPTPIMNVMVDRVASLLLVRLVAVATNPKDLSTAGICRSALLQGWTEWPHPITDAVVQQVKQYTRTILEMYLPENPYHNAQHATHVVMSTAHLIDQLLHSKGRANNKSGAANSRKKKTGPSSLFGLRHDPVSLLSLVFAALIHDVQHPGVPNRVLSAEDDDLAVLYNDQSVAEQHSLRLGFTELLKPEYADFQRLLGMNRQANGPAAPSDSNSTYRRFRRHVINLVLNTDIASPERTQLFKSKFREAFPPPPPAAGATMHSSTGTILASDYNISLDDDEDVVDNNGGEEEEGSMLQHLLRREGAINLSDDQGGMKPRSASLPTPSTMSLASPVAAGGRRFRQRLGIRRSMDLSGEAIEAFSSHSRRGSGEDPSGGGSSNHEDDDGFHNDDDDDDDTDELKASVVLECIMTACDVAHNLQGFAQMCTWSKRLYLELLRAHEHNRGPDPATKWFENQIGFLESYLIPLAARLDETGVFDLQFARIVRNSLDQWLVEGLEFTETMIREGGGGTTS